MLSKSTIKVNNLNNVYYCTKNKEFSGTIFLPKTKFPLRLENRKLLERDLNVYSAADFENLYKWQRSHLSEPEFVLHDGPPYANGQPHMGHAINKILKDTILRYNILQGNKVHYIPGWDCHGLPIELKALSNSYNIDPMEIRTKARQFAQKTIGEQKAVFKSWGVIGDWKNAYTTYSPEYVKIQLQQFYKLYKKNFIYRDIKPVYWSPSSRTALAEAELEYNKDHKSPSAFIRFEVRDVPKIQFLKDKRVYAIIWTTTPWTLPSNHAISYNENLSYSFVKKSDPQDTNIYVVATKLVSNLSSIMKCNFEEIHVVKGDLLYGASYIHPIYKNVFSFLHSSHATASKGTGLVHTAGAHGPDDFLVALSNKLSIVDLVNDLGCFNANAGPNLEGKYVLTDGNKAVLEMIKNDLMHLAELTHSYPYDWRTKKPVIIKASRQWFIDTNLIKNRATELLENVKVVPNERSEIYKKNLHNEIQKRPYWCISRQRQWGVPIPVFYDKDSSSVIINENTINHHCNLLETYGTDFWWQLSTKELLPDNLHSSNLDSLEKGQDIMDIWLDSGISWAKVLEGSKIADMYLEGVDQFMGWFQSSLLTSVAIRDKAPYKSIYVHGFAVDKNGNKMSKSIGNVVDPVEITSGKKGQKPYGIDTLRWWVTCHANQVSLASVSTSVLQSSADEVQKIRSVLRFALGCLSDYEISQQDKKDLLLIDKYMLHLLYQFHVQVNKFINEYQFHKISFAVINLLANQVSALYYTVIKDRLYCDNLDSPSRRAAQYTLLILFEIITQTIAPMVPHLAEEMYFYFPQKNNKTYFTSTHLKPDKKWVDLKVENVMEVILNCKKDINKELGARTTDANIEISISEVIFKLFKSFGTINDLEHQLEDILQVSKVRLAQETSIGSYELSISKSSKHSCLRCRRIQSEKKNKLCKRCSDVVHSLNDNKTAVSN